MSTATTSTTPPPDVGPWTPIDELPEFLTTQEVQAFLRISRSASYAFLKTRGVKVGRLVRVHRSVVAKLAAADKAR